MLKRLLVGVAVLVFALGLVPAAQAQVRFSVNTGGAWVGNAPAGYGYGNYGYGGYGGYGYGSRNYYAPPIVVNRYESAPQYYTTPATTSATAPAPYTGPGVIIRNPEQSGVALSYTIDERAERALEAGQSERLTEKGSYIIEFDRGDKHGTARYTIREGAYSFASTDRGWELYRQPIVATEDRVKANPSPPTDTSEPREP